MKRRVWELQATAERQARQVDTKEKWKDDEGSGPGLEKVSVGCLSPGLCCWDQKKKRKKKSMRRLDCSVDFLFTFLK